MPYIAICTENIEKGPSLVLDGENDYQLMEYLQGRGIVYTFPNRFYGQPINVLNGLEVKGYKVISTVVRGNTIIWTLHK